MKVVIIGAGKTGRGFVAPIMLQNKFDIVFIDKNIELVKELNRKSEYSVHYFNDEKEALEISGYKAFHIEDPQSLYALAEADIITTSVFANQIESLIPLLYEVQQHRNSNKRQSIICIENGVNVKKPLIDKKLDYDISEGVIFCTSLEKNGTLDIISEANIELPIDGVHTVNIPSIKGMPKEKNFPALIQRKIYTYNFISAIIAYLGSYKDYETYPDAANDLEILDVIGRVKEPLDRIISEEFDVDYNIQKDFSDAAVRKFRNREINDSIVRNAQQVARKLGKNERLLTPLRLGGVELENRILFEKIIAAAIYYAEKYEEGNVNDIINNISKEVDIEGLGNNLTMHYSLYRNKESLSEIFSLTK